MEAHVKTVREILHSGDQFLVPFFQRQYSWTKKEWHNLYTDVVALIESGDETKHFLGPLVCTPFHHVPGDGPRYQLIDGQQRLTTLTLALAALRDVARLKDLGDLADEIHEDFLVHRRRQDLQRFKVVPRLEDRRSYELAIDGNAPGVVAGTGIIGCHSFFKRAWRNPVADAGESMARRILVSLTSRMSLVAITVDGENPYEIFESLNWKGLPLEEADLIRNFLFMQVPPADQASFHEARWKPYESRFEAVGRYEKVPPTQFYRNYLMREGRYCPNKTAYVEFKRQNVERGLTTVEQVTELQRFATFELWLQRPELCEREYLKKRLAEFQQLDIATAHPLLLNLLDRHDRGHVNREELDDCFRDLASFVIRRTICGESTRAYGRWFPEAIQTISTRPSADLRRYWLEKGWPDDATFIARLAEFPIYLREKKKSRLLLEHLEREEGHREAVNLTNLSIEHVLPQTVENDEPGRSWQAELGGSWSQEHEKWVHVLGNLTLTGINPELGNNAFSVKKAMFARSNVSLNTYFAGIARWNGIEIKQRGIQLGRIITRLWNRPDGTPYVSQPPDVEDFFEETIAIPNEPRRPSGTIRVMIHWSLLGITAANFGNPAIPAVAAANFDYKKVLAIRSACSNAKMPVTDRGLVLDGAYYTNLLGDDVVAKSFIQPVAQPGVVEAQIRRLAGFDMYETVILPDNGEKLVGFASHPSGMAIAMRYLPPVADYDESGAVTDPETGLTFGYLRFTEIQSNRIFVTVECLYGFMPAIANGIQRIVQP